MSRISLGQHYGSGITGLFISKPGIDANVADPNSKEPWIFSSQWSKMANIIASGWCGQDTAVNFPNLGYIPYIFFERVFSGNTYVMAESIQYIGSTYTDGGTQFILQHLSGGSFQIIRQLGSAQDGTVGQTFRYIVFSLPTDF